MSTQLPENKQSNTTAATALFVTAVAMLLANGLYWFAYKTAPGYTGGGLAAAVGFLMVVGVVLYWPSLIMDDSTTAQGEPSTMRILCLVIVTTFCAVMLRTGWNTGVLPSLEHESNWVWLVTAALGAKAVQRFAEVQEKKDERKPAPANPASPTKDSTVDPRK
jgi:hypothetical protein